MTAFVEWTNRPDLPTIGIDRALRFQHPAIVEAHSYWQGLRRGRTMPFRSDIDPVEMRRFLTHIGLVEVPGPSTGRDDYFVRLAGEHVESVFGPISGNRPSKVLKPEIAERWHYGFSLVVAEGKPVRFAGRLAFEGKTYLDAEHLVAPLAGADGGIAVLFVACAAWPAGQPSG